MMKLVRYGVVVLFSLVLVGGVLGLSKPPVWQVEVHQDIMAPTTRIHGYLVDFKKWKLWAGHTEEADSEAVFKHVGGNSTGQGHGGFVGSTYTWNGPKVGGVN